MGSTRKKPLISVLIPFYNKAEMTIDCVQSLLTFGGNGIGEILLINNNSSESERQKAADYASAQQTVKVIDYEAPFNYQKLNNWAVKQSRGEFILFLNNDTELTEESRGLIGKMSQKAARPDVGAVGCLLLYGDKATIQHAGVFLLPGGQADHLYVGRKYKKILQNRSLPYDITKSRKLTAVTGAATMLERKKFDEVGGFDEKFIICGGDVDLCIRLAEHGFATWYVAGGYIVHKESMSRAGQIIPENDFIQSYHSYLRAYDYKQGDKYLPLAAQGKIF